MNTVLPTFEFQTSREMLAKVLRPVVRLSLRLGLKLQEIVEILKELLVEEGHKNSSQTKSAITKNASEVAVRTGVHRKDVVRLLSSAESTSLPVKRSLPTRVLGAWENQFSYKNKPRTLTSIEFYDLVASVSTDVNPSVVRAELLRAGSISTEELNGVEQLSCVRPTYIPKGNVVTAYELCASDLEGLLHSVHHNIISRVESAEDSSVAPRHHLRTEYDRIPVEDLQKINQWLLEEGHASHKRVREFLSQFDRDTSSHSAVSNNSNEATVSFSSFASITVSE